MLAKSDGRFLSSSRFFSLFRCMISLFIQDSWFWRSLFAKLTRLSAFCLAPSLLLADWDFTESFCSSRSRSESVFCSRQSLLQVSVALGASPLEECGVFRENLPTFAVGPWWHRVKGDFFFVCTESSLLTFSGTNWLTKVCSLSFVDFECTVFRTGRHGMLSCK